MTSPDTHTDPPITPKRLVFLVAVPLAWGALLWFHPAVGPDSVYEDLRDQVGAYLIVHVGTLIFIGLMGVALYMLVRDLPGRAATISRLAIGPFVLFYAADPWDRPQAPSATVMTSLPRACPAWRCRWRRAPDATEVLSMLGVSSPASMRSTRRSRSA
jgi:hypothetical protein